MAQLSAAIKDKLNFLLAKNLDGKTVFTMGSTVPEDAADNLADGVDPSIIYGPRYRDLGIRKDIDGNYHMDSPPSEANLLERLSMFDDDNLVFYFRSHGYYRTEMDDHSHYTLTAKELITREYDDSVTANDIATFRDHIGYYRHFNELVETGLKDGNFLKEISADETFRIKIVQNDDTRVDTGIFSSTDTPTKAQIDRRPEAALIENMNYLIEHIENVKDGQLNPLSVLHSNARLPHAAAIVSSAVSLQEEEEKKKSNDDSHNPPLMTM